MGNPVNLTLHVSNLLALLIVLAIVALFSSPVFALGYEAEPGWTIFNHTDGPNLSYRYGPSIIIDGNNTIHLWSCSPGAGTEWDWIRLMRSWDNGNTWKEGVDLQPTDSSADALSACDPGIVRYAGYYYLAYTSTMNSAGTENHVFVARKGCMNCTWEKWNGNGWGGNPSPFIWYTGPSDKYGAGEPSLVVKDGLLYIYYTWISADAAGNTLNQTRVATASADDPNWPASVVYRGVAVGRVAGEDSTDIKYIESQDIFIGVAVGNRFAANCYIRIYESSDGSLFPCSRIFTRTSSRVATMPESVAMS